MSPLGLVLIAWSAALLTALLLKIATSVWIWRQHGEKVVKCGDRTDHDPKTQVSIVLCGDVSDAQAQRSQAQANNSTTNSDSSMLQLVPGDAV